MSKIRMMIASFILLFLNAIIAIVIPDDSLLSKMLESIQSEPAILFAQECSNRDVWEHSSKTASISFHIRKAKQYASTPFPPWKDESYLNFKKTGIRTEGQIMMDSRSNRLVSLALAECSQFSGSYINLINDELESVANQKSWSWPAHGMMIFIISFKFV